MPVGRVDLESAEVVGKGWEGLEQVHSEIENAVARYQGNLQDLFV